MIHKYPSDKECKNMNLSEQEIIDGQYSLLEKGYIERHVIGGKEFFTLTEKGRLSLENQTEETAMH